jgi:hypothetical protein
MADDLTPDLQLPDGVELPEAAETLDQLLDRLAAAHPEMSRGRIHAIVVEEHGLLVGLEPGDIVPPIVVAATIERVLRDVAKAREIDELSVERDDDAV